jgi:hypothetical protein
MELAFSSSYTTQNFTRKFTVSAKRTLRYRHQTRIRNPAHQSVACASKYIKMPVQMGKAGFCEHAKSLIVAPVFGFHFVMYGVENKMAL